MDRRDFCGKAGAGAAGAVLLPMAGRGHEVQERRRYEYKIEIVEAPPGGCGAGLEVGNVYGYPEEKGRICDWLMDSMDGFLRVLQNDGNLHWTYAGTPYEKVSDPDGVTTEFVRCPDPQTVVVAKIIRTRTE